jgi:hypothetical protein
MAESTGSRFWHGFVSWVRLHGMLFAMKRR